MPTLKSGAVILGAYATKIRKTLFAQLRDKLRAGEISSQEIARAAGELNRILYTLFVERLKLEKGDVVRVSIDYEILNSKIVWNWEKVKIECYKRLSDEEVIKILRGILTANLQKGYEVRMIRETRLGDLIFEVIENGKRVGLLVVTSLNGEAIIRGAIRPNLVIPKTRIKSDTEIEKYLSERIGDVLKVGTQGSEEEVEKILEEISSL